MDFDQARFNMVQQQVRTWGVLNHTVLDVLADLPREAFVSYEYRRQAYADVALPIGHDQHMFKPVVEGRMLQALNLCNSDQVLEIGSGSGYFTACLSRLAGSVLSLEYHQDLFRAAQDRAHTLKLDNIRFEHADALAGYRPEARFDVIVLGGAVVSLPDMVADWLRPGGRLLGVFGHGPMMEARLIHMSADGQWRTESVFDTVVDYLIGAEPHDAFTF